MPDPNQNGSTHSYNVDQADFRAGNGGANDRNLLREVGDIVSGCSCILVALGQTPLLIVTGPALRGKGNGLRNARLEARSWAKERA